VIQRAIALPFSFNSAGEVSYTTDEAKIIQDRLVLAIMSRPGERVMRPSFGSAIYETMFEDENTAIAIATEAVAACFTEFFPYLEFIEVLPDLDGEGTLELEVRYRKSQQTLTESLSIKTKIFSRAGEVLQEVR
jgi:phage baseplate assembly protein W